MNDTLVTRLQDLDGRPCVYQWMRPADHPGCYFFRARSLEEIYARWPHVTELHEAISIIHEDGLDYLGRAWKLIESGGWLPVPKTIV